MKKAIILISLISNQVFGLEIQSKKQNSDRQMYIINPTAKIQKVKSQLGLNAAYSKYPLVSRGVISGNVVPLINDVKTFDFSYAYKINNSFQMGLLATIHQVSSNDQISTSYLDSFMIEGKYNFLKNFALNPYFLTASSTDVSIINGSKVNILKLGQIGGAYGLKLIFDIPFFKENNVSLFLMNKQSLKNDSYLNIDQTNVITAGVSSTIKMTKDFSWKNEIYVESTKNNTPIELLSYVSMKNNTYQIQAGIGTGNIQGSGANTYKGFAGITFLFDENFQILKSNKPEYDRSYNKSQQKALEESEEMEQQTLPSISRPSATYAKKYSRTIASEKGGILKTLPNGKKVKVFKNKITEMPIEIGVDYVTESEYKQLMKNTKKSKSLKKDLISIEKPVEAQPIVEPTKNENNENVLTNLKQNESKNSVEKIMDDSDPVNLIVESISKDIFYETTPIVEEKKVEIVQPRANYVMDDMSEKIKKENELIDSLIQNRLEKKQKDEKEEKKKMLIEEVIKTEEKISLESGLIEHLGKSYNKLDDKKMKPVKINEKTKAKDLIIQVPKINISKEEKIKKAEILIEKKEEPVYYDDTNLLNESEDMEEASSPIF